MARIKELLSRARRGIVEATRAERERLQRLASLSDDPEVAAATKRARARESSVSMSETLQKLLRGVKHGSYSVGDIQKRADRPHLSWTKILLEPDIGIMNVMHRRRATIAGEELVLEFVVRFGMRYVRFINAMQKTGFKRIGSQPGGTAYRLTLPASTQIEAASSAAERINALLKNAAR